LQNDEQGLGETFGRVTIEAMAFGLPVCHLCYDFLPLKHCYYFFELRTVK